MKTFPDLSCEVLWCPRCGPAAKAPMKRMPEPHEHSCDLCHQAFKVTFVPSPDTDALLESFYGSERKPHGNDSDSAIDPGSDSGGSRKPLRRRTRNKIHDDIVDDASGGTDVGPTSDASDTRENTD